jgi:molecular chaperone GrpE (heat shock protein)
VVDEWQRGYRLGERVIRPAKVRVGKRAAGSLT